MDYGQIIVLVLQGLQVVGTLLPASIEAALKLKSILEVDGSDFTVQIQTLQDGALKSAEDTMAVIEAWKKEHGYEG
jgi:hypothetical protein